MNLAGSDNDWEHDYRVPDGRPLVFLKEMERPQNISRKSVLAEARADFVCRVIVSPGDRTHEKLPAFYGRLGVHELFSCGRPSWPSALRTFYRLHENGLEKLRHIDFVSGMVCPRPLGVGASLQFRLVRRTNPGRKSKSFHTWRETDSQQMAPL